MTFLHSDKLGVSIWRLMRSVSTERLISGPQTGAFANNTRGRNILTPESSMMSILGMYETIARRSTLTSIAGLAFLGGLHEGTASSAVDCPLLVASIGE